MPEPNIIPSAEPFFNPGGSTGCLLDHGYTGTPIEMRAMGDHMAGKGYILLGIRLAGHATKPEDLSRIHWSDWIGVLEDG